MEPIYLRMIRDGKINNDTGKAWTVEDVPLLWREKVRKALEDELAETVES
jgi:hypothetical protein